MKHSLYLVYLRYVIISILAFSIISCASVSVNHIVPSNSHPAHLPERIYIESFEAPPLHFQVNRKGKDLMKLIENERTQLANDLLLRLNKRIAPTFLLLPGEAPPTGNFWLLKGSFEVVQEGSRILRAGIGLGLGKTKMETDVQLIDLSGNSKQSLLLKMKTTGGSGMAPGAAAAFTAA